MPAYRPATSPDSAQLRHAFLTQLPDPARDAVSRIVDAGAHDGRVFVAGGVVRDLLLGRPIVDVDLVTEGSAPDIVGRALPGARVTAHARFLTATVTAGRSKIDVATSRSETYARPGALPTIARAPIEADLTRRDFSMNAMALRLDAEPELLDPAGGIADTGAACVRVLHDRSFIDDATRIFRALRYAARLGFTLDAHTRDLLQRGVRYIEPIGGERLRRELELMLHDVRGGEALESAERLGMLRATDAALSWDTERSDALAYEGGRAIPLVPYGFALLAARADSDGARSIVARLRLKRDQTAAVVGMAALREVSATLRRANAKPSGIVVLLDRYPPASIAAFAATAEDSIARQLALRYLEDWRQVKPMLRGDDVIALGVPRGPQVERALQLIRAARLDGIASDEGDERGLAARFAKSIRDSAAARHERMNAEVKLHANGH
jgi:tRNA nucleotidyltransferase (CCA-adding enzyme)